MNGWNEGYFTESTYTYGYYGELSPVYQSFCLLANGICPPELNERSVHCELGYGQGVSINVHAAANPGRYIGTDFNPSHAAHANELLKASGSPSQFFDDSFEEMLKRDDLPKFDSISLHGIWAWVSPENQKNIMEFARRFLKPGGIFYNSYNALPGWAPDAPLRELFSMYDKYAHQSSDTYKRAEEAIKFTEELLAASPVYLKYAPNMSSFFKHVRDQNHDYLAHEYFNGNWQCIFFTEMMEALQPAKLDYACTAILLDIIDGFNLSKEATEFLRKIENPVLREQARDYFVNRKFRKDMYIRGIRRIPKAEQIQRLLGMRYVLVTREEVPLRFKVPIGEVVVSEEVYKPILEYLSEDDGSPKDFMRFHREHPEIHSELIISAIIVLVHRNLVQPCQSEEAASAVKKQCDSLNSYLCERARVSGDITSLASPVTGGAVGVDRMGQLFLLSYKQGKQDADTMAKAVWDILSSQGQVITTKEKRLETAEENLAELRSKTERFLEKLLPILKAIEIA